MALTARPVQQAEMPEAAEILLQERLRHLEKPQAEASQAHLALKKQKTRGKIEPLESRDRTQVVIQPQMMAARRPAGQTPSVPEKSPCSRTPDRGR
jgi:hypothetical protein